MEWKAFSIDNRTGSFQLLACSFSLVICCFLFLGLLFAGLLFAGLLFGGLLFAGLLFAGLLFAAAAAAKVVMCNTLVTICSSLQTAVDFRMS